MKSYETVFILNPALSEDQVAKSISKYEKFLKSNGATLVHKESWGLKKLAYTIENKNSGFYNLFQFTAPSEIISPFEVEFSRDERIIRWQTVRLDKFALEYAERRKNKLSTNAKAE